jgi:putative hydrolase of the HAD superfamily
MDPSPTMKTGLARIRAVTFDVGGTLIEPWPSVGHAYAEIAAQFQMMGVDPAALNGEFLRVWQARRRFDYSREAWRQLVDQTFAPLSREPLSDACFDAIYGHFSRKAAWRIFGDVLPALAHLRSHGVQCGLISNWDERLRPLLDELDLTRQFEVIGISCEAGYAKPAPEIFAQVARSFSLPAHSILHVGDSASEDFAGAQAAGMQAILLDRADVRPGERAISSLSALVGLLEQGCGKQVSD